MNTLLALGDAKLDDRSLRSASLVDLAHADLQLKIASGSLKEGDRIVIDALAREYGTSQIPIREALVRLLGERFVTFERNKGYRVAPKPDAVEMRQLFEARLVLEVGAMDIAIAYLDAATIHSLHATNRKLAALDPSRSIAEYREFITTNEHFHLILMRLSGNNFLIDAYNRLGYHKRIVQTLYGKGVPDSARIVREHEEIIAAMKKGDPDAVRESIRLHIVGGYDRLDMPAV